MTAKAVIVAEVERLRWRIWNGKAKNAQRSIKRIRKVMHVFKGEHEPAHEGGAVAQAVACAACESITISVAKPPGWSITPKRYRAGERVGTSITEGTANFLVNRRMNKSQQMRWSREAPICCSRSAAQSTTARSGRVRASI